MAKTGRPLTLAITTGDVDGIGLEVTLKALAQIKPSKKERYLVFRDPKTPRFLKTIEKKVRARFSEDQLKFISSHSNPADWVESAARLCLNGDAEALVTAPLSKETIRDSGRKAIGHTEILKSVSGAKSIHMAFLGRHFNVLLASGHLPLRKLTETLSAPLLTDALTAATGLRAQLGGEYLRRPIALVGLNPHAGENGLIGSEERTLYKKVLQRAKRLNVAGPLVPDAAFLKENWSKYSVYVCPYHDQGLIPFKLVHGHDHGVQFSFGLPFVRTSVDHGTAKDIFGQNIANSGSMLDAIQWAARLARKG